MDKTQALQNLLDGTASEEEINFLKHGLASGEISIGGNVNQSVIIIGSGNRVELTPEALDLLNARPLLGDLDRDLTGKEIALGLERLESELSQRAPVLTTPFQEQARRLRPSLKTNAKSLSDHTRKERVEALAVINSLCMEALDISFNALCLGEESPEYDARSPFRGLESFRPEDSEFFFGREALTGKLVGKIQAHSFLAILGASGSGKSSLVMAGLIPALGLDYIIFRPGINPLGALESAQEKALIVVDQFEELFTLTHDEATRKEFITKLLDASKRSRIILTLRSDFLGEVATYRALNEEVQSHLEIVPPMDMDELRRAMEGQAGVVGLRFEADLSQQILDDVEGEPGAMPLLQHALWELWNRRHGRNLRASEYRAFGGVRQAITSTAEKVYADCSKPEQDQLRDIFLRLTRLDEGDEGRDTRRRVPLGDLIPSGRDAASIALLLDKLANARLIVKTVNEDKTEVEVAHEALIRHWERLRLWLNEDRDALRLRESVSESAREWENVGRDESMLNHRGGRLDDAVLLENDTRYGLTVNEKTYLNACVILRNKEQRERERRLRYTVFASIAAAIIFLILGSFAITQGNSANRQALTAQAANTFALEQERTAQANADEASEARAKAEWEKNIALARQIAAQSQSLYVTDSSKQMIALLLGIQSMQMYPTWETALILQDNSLSRPIFDLKHDDSVNSVAFSLDGKFVVSGSDDGTVRSWDPFTGKEINRIINDGEISLVVVSRDNKYLAAVECVDWTASHLYCSQNIVHVWYLATGKEIARLEPPGTVESINFSPNSERLAAGGCDEGGSKYICPSATVYVWNVVTRMEVSRQSYSKGITSVVFSPDGKFVASGGRDENVHIWNPETGREIVSMHHGGDVYSIAFSPNGNYIVSGGEISTAHVWETFSGKKIASVDTGYSGGIWSVAFNPAGNYIVSGDSDGNVIVWDATTEIEIFSKKFEKYARFVSFSPDGNYVLATGCDHFGLGAYSTYCDQGSAYVWEINSKKTLARMIQDSEINSVAFSPDSNYVVSSGSMSAQIWEVDSRKKISHSIEDSFASSVAISPDSKYLASQSMDYSVFIWELATGKEILHFVEEESTTGVMYISIYDDSVAFSSDGKYLVAAGLNTARVFEITTGKEIAYFKHEAFIDLIAISPNGKYVILSGDNIVRIWDLATGHEITRVLHDSGVSFAEFSPNGDYVASVGCDQKDSDDNCILGSARVWESTTGKEIAHMIYSGIVTSIDFSPNGEYLFSGGCDRRDIAGICIQGSARVWNVESGKEISRMTYDGGVNTVAFSPDGKTIISGSDDYTLNVWDAFTGIEISRMKHNSGVLIGVFSPDSKFVASLGINDDLAHIWEVETGIEVFRITNIDYATEIAFSPDGKYVVSAGFGDTIHVMVWQPNDLISDACSRVTRNLTRDEWDQYIGNALPYQVVCPNLPIEP